MSRLYTYLNESEEDIPKFIKGIKSDCLPFIKEMEDNWKTYPKFLYRGMKSGEYLSKHTVRNDRRPLHTPKEIHDLVDINMKKKFGWKPRSEGLFVTPSKDEALGYGPAYYIFPIGNYKYIWSPYIEDFYVDLRSKFPSWMLNKDKHIKELNVRWEWKFDDKRKNDLRVKNNITWLTSKTKEEYIAKSIEDRERMIGNFIKSYVMQCIDYDLERALNISNEVMFKCDKYYAMYSTYMEPKDLAKELLDK